MDPEAIRVPEELYAFTLMEYRVLLVKLVKVTVGRASVVFRVLDLLPHVTTYFTAPLGRIQYTVILVA